MAKKNAGIQVLQEPLHPNQSPNEADPILVVFEISNRVGRAAPQLETMAKNLVDQVKSSFSLKTAMFYFRPDPSATLNLLASSARKMSVKKTQPETDTSSLVTNVAESGKPHYSEEENFFPVLFEDRPLGVLSTVSPAGKPISETQRSALLLLCSQAAIWFARATEMTKASQSLDRLRSAHHISSVIQGSNPDESIGKAVHILQELHPDSKIAFLSAEARGNLRVKAYSGLTAHETTTLRLKAGFGLAGACAQSRKAMVLKDAVENPESTGLSPDSRSILAAPVIYAGNLVGVLDVENPHPAKFDELDLEVLKVLADNIAAVLTNISLLSQVRNQVEQQRKLFDITDKLRGSVDRTAIMNASVAELSKALNLRKVTLTLTSPTSKTTPNEEAAQ